MDYMPAQHSTITEAFLGELEIREGRESTDNFEEHQINSDEKIITKPFIMLSLDLPPTPLFKDAFDKMQIPQVPLFKLLKKYGSETVHESVRAGPRRYRITR